MSKIKAAVFASGTGSNFQAIMEEHETLGCEVVLLVCDKPEARVLAKAKAFNIPTFVFDAKAYPSKAAYEEEIVDKLQEKDVSWIFLAGYMRIVGETLLHAFEGRTINIHPSLLPAFPGIDAVGQALRAGVEQTGVTVHYIDAGIDTGPIIAQEIVSVYPDDTEATLLERIQLIEHRLYPSVIKTLMN